MVTIHCENNIKLCHTLTPNLYPKILSPVYYTLLVVVVNSKVLDTTYFIAS